MYTAIVMANFIGIRWFSELNYTRPFGFRFFLHIRSPVYSFSRLCAHANVSGQVSNFLFKSNLKKSRPVSRSIRDEKAQPAFQVEEEVEGLKGGVAMLISITGALMNHRSARILPPKLIDRQSARRYAAQITNV